jgi:DNA-binding transcriptional regulator YiaG
LTSQIRVLSFQIRVDELPNDRQRSFAAFSQLSLGILRQQITTQLLTKGLSLEDSTMHNLRLQSAADYIKQHELDLIDANDICSSNVQEYDIPTETVKMVRESLELSTELFAQLLGISVSTVFRYENVSLPPFPQGHIARKIGILVGWLNDPKSATDIRKMLSKQDGLSVLAGLLQSESVTMFLKLSNLSTSDVGQEKDNYLMGISIFDRVAGKS